MQNQLEILNKELEIAKGRLFSEKLHHIERVKWLLKDDDTLGDSEREKLLELRKQLIHSL